MTLIVSIFKSTYQEISREVILRVKATYLHTKRVRRSPKTPTMVACLPRVELYAQDYRFGSLDGIWAK